MRKLCSILPLALLSIGSVWGSPIQFTLNTSSVSGTNGSLDFALFPGPGSDKSLTATVSGFVTVGGSYGGTETLTGNATGGPVVQGGTLTLLANTATQDNDDLETLKFGNSLTFVVNLSGPALTAPDGLGTSPYQFVFYTYSDAGGTIPVLTTDPNGVSGVINISPAGVVTTNAVSRQLSISTIPEPGTLSMLGCAFAVLGGIRYRRRPFNA